MIDLITFSVVNWKCSIFFCFLRSIKDVLSGATRLIEEVNRGFSTEYYTSVKKFLFIEELIIMANEHVITTNFCTEHVPTNSFDYSERGKKLVERLVQSRKKKIYLQEKKSISCEQIALFPLIVMNPIDFHLTWKDTIIDTLCTTPRHNQKCLFQSKESLHLPTATNSKIHEDEKWFIKRPRKIPRVKN